MKVAVIQSNYIPWKGYFDIIHDADVFCFYDEVKYTKNDWRNRNKLYSKNGLFWLTIPIDKEAVKLKISEVKFTNSNWMIEHLTVIRETYKKTPFFYQLEPIIEDLYINKNWEFISEFNQYSIEKIASRIGIQTEFISAKDYNLEGDRIERLINLLIKIGATEYISGPAAKNYLSGQEHLFKENGIKLVYKDYTGYPEYRQLIKPFEQGVSIIDLITNIDFENIPFYIWGWRDSKIKEYSH